MVGAEQSSVVLASSASSASLACLPFSATAKKSTVAVHVASSASYFLFLLLLLLHLHSALEVVLDASLPMAAEPPGYFCREKNQEKPPPEE